MKLIIYPLHEVCEMCGVDEAEVLRFIEQEWIHPRNQADRSFDEEDLTRIKLIHELMEDLGVNEEAVPIILKLLDQVNYLHLRIRQG